MWPLPTKPEPHMLEQIVRMRAVDFISHRIDLVDLSDCVRYSQALKEFDQAYQQLLTKMPADLRAELVELEERALMVRSMAAEGYYLQGLTDLLHFMAHRPPTKTEDAAT